MSAGGTEFLVRPDEDMPTHVIEKALAIGRLHSIDNYSNVKIHTKENRCKTFSVKLFHFSKAYESRLFFNCLNIN